MSGPCAGSPGFSVAWWAIPRAPRTFWETPQGLEAGEGGRPVSARLGRAHGRGGGVALRQGLSARGRVYPPRKGRRGLCWVGGYSLALPVSVLLALLAVFVSSVSTRHGLCSAPVALCRAHRDRPCSLSSSRKVGIDKARLELSHPGQSDAAQAESLDSGLSRSRFWSVAKFERSWVFGWGRARGGA